MPISALPPAPDPNNRATFKALAYPWSLALNTYSTQATALEVNVNAKEASASVSAISALSSATSVLGATGAPLWVSGTTYAFGFVVYSAVNQRAYRRIVAGDGTTNPATDTANWAALLFDIQTGLPTIRPTLLLDFANSKTVDPRVTFTRASTGTYFDAQGVLRTAAVNQPRLDHNPLTGVSLGLLIEEARTNLALNSEAITASNGTDLTANSSVAPDGAMSMDLIYDDTSTGEHYANDRIIAVTATVTYTWSVFVKDGASANRSLYLRIATGSTAYVIFNPITKVLSGSGGSEYVSSGIEDIGGGIYRAWITYTAAATQNTVHRFQLRRDSGTVYTGDGASGLFIWGAQLEVGAFPTSYIPTAGSTVTRTVDLASMTGTNFSSWYRQDEGTLVGCGQTISTIANSALLSADDTTTTERIQMRFNGVSTASFIVVDGGVTQFTNSTTAGSWPIGTRITSGIAYKLNDVISSSAGLLSTLDTAVTIPTTTQLQIGFGAGIFAFSGHIANLSYYPRRLSNATLQALTS